jgi:hypothetical protein
MPATIADLFRHQSNLIMLDWLNTSPEDKSQGAFKTYCDGMASDEKKVCLVLS